MCRPAARWRVLLWLVLWQSLTVQAHPLRLSLSELDYDASERLLTISLRLFLMDVNEALVFDPNSSELAFCTPNESEDAERLLLGYLEQFFSVKANGEQIKLKLKSKQLSGEGMNTALALLFEHRVDPRLDSLEIKNAVFTDLFFDQSNIVYVHVNGESHSLMLNKETPLHRLSF